MTKRRILVSWIGHTDLRCMAAALPEKKKSEFLELIGVATQAGDEFGPLRTLINAESFDEIILLSNYPNSCNRAYEKWVGVPVKIVSVELPVPTDYAQIYRVADGVLADVRRRVDAQEAELCFHLSPGTPAMAAVWLLLGKSRYPATLYQTFRGKAAKATIPFDITLDVVPELLRNPDAHLQHLAAQGPAEIAGFEQIAGDSRAIRLAVGRAKRAAVRGVPILLLGESGTGKEMFARAIHESSPRRSGNFVAVNCAAISRELLESELFGHVKGAFTGADANRAGAFQQADGGTLFLDEVGECDLAMQAKLLRVLQPLPEQGPCSRVFRRVGDTKDTTADVRVIAATNRDLLAAVSAQAFREDLYYRLAVISIKLPPLRDRRGDIPSITERLLSQINRQFSKEEPGYVHKSISDAAIAFVKRHPWPGNVRQLFNALVQAAVMSESDVIERHDIEAALAELPGSAPASTDPLEKPLGADFNLETHLNDIHRHYLRRAMVESNGVKTRAARLLGIENYQTLDAQLKRLNVTGPWKRTDGKQP